MTTFIGTNGDNIAFAGVSLTGFTGTKPETIDDFGDIYDAREGDDFVQAGDSHDQLLGGDGSDTLKGGGGDDVLDGGFGLDDLHGQAGNDIFVMHSFQFIDNVDGGEGTDTLDLRDITDQGATVDLSAGTYTVPVRGTADVISVETVLGTENADTMEGSAAVETLLGNGGDDSLAGGNGVDLVKGGGGDDSLVVREGEAIDAFAGGEGIDTLDLSSITSLGTVIDLAGGTYQLEGGALGGEQAISGIETILGSARTDIITGSTAAESFEGRGGFDLLKGGGGDDSLSGGGGDDTLLGNDGRDTMAGGGGLDELHAGTGADQLSGGEGNDFIDGAAANDTIDGGGGNDVLVGGAGADAIRGGAGPDRFDFNRIAESGTTAATRDTISDFTHLQDVLDFSTIDAKAGAGGEQAFDFIGTGAFSGEGQIRAVQAGADTIIEVNSEGGGGAEMTVRLVNVLATSLTDADFIL